jgi:hypothetical protein
MDSEGLGNPRPNERNKPLMTGENKWLDTFSPSYFLARNTHRSGKECKKCGHKNTEGIRKKAEGSFHRER